MTQQIMLNRNEQKMDQSNKGRRNAKNALLPCLPEINSTDLMGLSWVFTDDDWMGMKS